MSSQRRKESKKSKPQKYEEHERKVAAAIQYKHEHPDASWEFLHREFGPSANTIKNRFHNRTLPRRRAQTGQQRLSGSQEDIVVARIKELDAAGRPPTAKKIRAIANTLVQEKYGATVHPIGRQWVNRLYKRRSGEIARRQLERGRLAAQYRDEVEQHVRRLITPSNILSSFRRAGVFPLNKRRVLDDTSIQWQARNPYRRKLDHLRPLPHRNPLRTEVESLAAERESIRASQSAAPESYTTALKSWGQKALESLQKLEGELILTRHELAEVRRSKALKTADKRVLTRLRSGTSIRELRKARQDRLQKDARKTPRAKRSTAGSEGARRTQATQPSTPPYTS